MKLVDTQVLEACAVRCVRSSRTRSTIFKDTLPMSKIQIPYFHIDAFTSKLFNGNPAGVCILERWLPTETMQKIAAENRHSETAFLVKESNQYLIRFFTPEVEVDLCGHATLSSAHVIQKYLEPNTDRILFKTTKTTLTAIRSGTAIELRLPSFAAKPMATPAVLSKALNTEVLEYYETENNESLALVASQAIVANLSPDMSLISQLNTFGTVVTSRGTDCDFVSRYFAPKIGIPEDPATGVAHCILTPFWSKKLGKTTLTATQLSSRVGNFVCTDLGKEVALIGSAVTYLRGTLEIDTSL